MAKSIYDMQNEDIYLKCLATQRKIYSKAKCLDGIIVFLIIVLIIYQSLICKIYNFDLGTKITVPFVLSGFTFILSNKIKEKKKAAADLQQYIDINLYSKITETNFEDWGYTYSANKINDLLSKYECKYDEYKKVKNWYEDYSKLTPVQQVYYCQRENIRWDYKLRRNYITILIIIGFIYLILAINSFISDIALTVVCAIPIFDRIKKDIYDLHKDCQRLTRMKAKIDIIIKQIENKNIKNEIRELADLQNEIKENRESAKLIPDCFYAIYEKKFHKKEKIIANNANNTRCGFSIDDDKSRIDSKEKKEQY